jgi:DNA-directed RNA polymerase subunit RPC12/RpoP
MPRYIDADKLIAEYDRVHIGAPGGARKLMENAPTADVVEVKYGKWISVEGDVIFKCSNCDAEISTSWNYENDDMFSYCPCCGAKMKGGERE